MDTGFFHQLVPICLKSQQTQSIHSMPFQYWATVCVAGPTLKQHWMNALCLQGYQLRQGPTATTSRAMCGRLQTSPDDGL